MSGSTRCTGARHHIVPRPGSGKAGPLPGPGKQRRAVTDAANGTLGRVFTGGGGDAMRHQICRSSRHHPARHAVARRRRFARQHFGHARRSGPDGGRQFVTTQLQAARREPAHHLAQQRDDQVPGRRRGGVDHVHRMAPDADPGPVLAGVAQAGQHGVQGQRHARAMRPRAGWRCPAPALPPRHLFGGKRFGGAAASPDTAAKDSGDRQPLAPQGGLLPQGRGGVGFQPERLVIAEMPVEPVHLAQRDQAEQPQQGVGLHEMPRANQVLAAPAKARRCDGAAPPARCRAPECRARPPRNSPRPRAPAPRPPPPGSGSSAKNTRLRPSAAHRCRWCNATRARQGWYRRSAASGSNWIRQGCQAATRPRNHRCRIGTGRG